jgi:hypothetical protein
MTEHRMSTSLDVGRRAGSRAGRGGGSAEARALEQAEAERTLRAEARRALADTRDALAASREEVAELRAALEQARGESERLGSRLEATEEAARELNARLREDMERRRELAGTHDAEAAADLEPEPDLAPAPISGTRPAPIRASVEDALAVAEDDLPAGARWLARTAIRKLPALLSPGERLITVAIGRAHGSGCLVAVTDRGLYSLGGGANEGHQLVPYSAITRGEIRRGRFGRMCLRLTTASGDVVVFGRLEQLEQLEFQIRSGAWHSMVRESA